jgi:hypothetical protein
MTKSARILAVVMITVGLLAGAIIPSIPVYADIAGAPDYYKLTNTVTEGGCDAAEGIGINGSSYFETVATYYLIIGRNESEIEFESINMGIIFPAVELPDASEAQVLSAYIKVHSDGLGYRDLIAFIYGEDAPNPEMYVNSENASISIRNRTDISVYIDADTLEDADYYIDVTPVVEALQASPNWSQSNKMSFLFIADTERGDYLGIYGSYECFEEWHPELTIYYAPVSETHYVIPFGHEDTIDAGVSQTISESEDCADYHVMNAQDNDSMLIGFQYYEANYIGTTNYLDERLGFVMARSIIGFDTSVLPDDASITDASLFMNAYMHFSTTDNSSIVVTKFTDRSILARFMEMGSPFFNRSKFEGNLGEFDSREFPQYDVIFTLPNNSDIVVKTTLTGVNSFIDKTNYTLLGLRDILDINDVCPDGITSNGSTTSFRLIPPKEYQFSSYGEIEPPAPSWLVVDIEEESIIPASSPVSVMMTIQALIFALGGILGILTLLMKPDAFSFGLRAGLLLGLTIMTVVGVAMLESIIVAMT